MASYSFLVLILSLVFGLNLIETRSQGIRLSITPDRCIATTVNDVQISCVPNGGDDEDKEVTLIEISRNNEGPIAFLKQCSNVSYGSDTQGQFQADGYIGKNFNQTYLNLTLTNPQSEDTGIYTCVMYYVDGTGVLRNEKASQNVLVEKLDVKSLETVLNTLKDKINDVEQKSKDQSEIKMKELDLEKFENVIDQLSAKVITLEGQNSALTNNLTAFRKKTSQQISDLDDRVGYTVAFSATTHTKIPTTAGMVLILPDLLMQVGHAYDTSTGIFTAPRNGIYVFHVVLMESKHCDFDLELKSNGKIVARLFTRNFKTYDQSSISSVVKLQAGDKVYNTVQDGKCDVHNNIYTLFTGYLLNAV